jgi:hypothetical protein
MYLTGCGLCFQLKKKQSGKDDTKIKKQENHAENSFFQQKDKIFLFIRTKAVPLRAVLLCFISTCP